MVQKRANYSTPGTKYKRAKIVFAVTPIALSLASLDTKWSEYLVQSVGVPVPFPTLSQKKSKNTQGRETCASPQSVWSYVK